MKSRTSVKGIRTISVLVVVTALLSGCGGIHSTVTTPPNSVVGLKLAVISPVAVTSKEQNADALALNDEAKKLAAEELQSMLASKGIAGGVEGDVLVTCAIDITYGNKALRYFVGFGAGAGHIKVRLTLKDASGSVRYATLTESDLAIGAFGGDMKKVMREAIRAAVKEVGSRL